MPTLWLDRAALDRGEEIWKRFYGDFSLSPEPPQKDYGTPECLESLGLKRDATLADVKRAFACLARTTHVDTEGRQHPLLRPLGERSRRDLEQQILTALGLAERTTP